MKEYHSQNQETTAKSTTKTKKKQGKNKIVAFAKGVIVYFLVLLSLFSVFSDEYSKEYLEHKKTYKQIIKNRDSSTKGLINKHAQTLLDKYPNDPEINKIANSLMSDYESNFEYNRKEIKKYNSKKKELAYEHSFRGRSSFSFWISLFGIVTLGLYFSIKSLFDSISRGSTFRHQLVDITGIVVSVFWAIHLLFLTQKDFLNNKYFAVIIFCSSLISMFVYFLVKKYNYKDIIIDSLLSLIFRIKSKHYRRLAVKSLYAEKHDEALLSLDTVKQNAQEFDKDIAETIDKI